MKKTKFVIVGAGNRGLGCFAKGLRGFKGKSLPEFVERAELVAWVDNNLARARVSAKEVGLPELPLFTDIAAAQRAAPADWAIVASPDYTHARIVIAALEAGLNVVVDKPLATSAWECDQIIAAAARTGREVRVGHNMRYHPWTLKACQLVREGAIGDVVTVEAAEVLDYNHGGDYFHRWHSDFAKSAGLMTHKCCHQLDLICWLLNDDPVAVASSGGRAFYCPSTDFAHGPRCLECVRKDICPHRFNMNKWDGVYHKLFKESEHADGYIRDLCVFSDRHTVTDHQATTIRFAKGTLCSFVLQTFSPREYVYFFFTGTKGRLELGDTSWDRTPYLRLIRADGTVENLPCVSDHGEHGHGGADTSLLADILDLPGSHPLQRATMAEARRAVLIADLSSRSLAAGGGFVPASAAGKDYPPAPPR